MIEKMIADMLGITPQEMSEMLGGMQTLLKDGVAQLNTIETQNREILARIGVLETKGIPDVGRTE